MALRSTTADLGVPQNLDTPAAAGWLNCVSPRTLETWRSLKKGPRYVKVGGRVVYRLSDLEAWMAARTVEPSR